MSQLQLDYIPSAYENPDGVMCAQCGHECEWEQCYVGDEDGFGGSFWCINRQCETQQIFRIIKRQ